MQRSRLSRKIEKQTKKNLFLSAFGIIVVVILLIQFGLPFLVNTTMFISGVGRKTDISKKDKSLHMPPILDSTYTATNSATITVTGRATDKEKVRLYINEDLVDEVTVKDDGIFSFEDIALKAGENKIKAKSITPEKKESDFSNTITIIHKNKAPTLTIDSPTDGQSFQKDDKTVNVTGKTDPGTKVTVNDFWAIVDETGTFSYTLQLVNGENKIKVEATDEAGNKTTKETKVNYSS